MGSIPGEQNRVKWALLLNHRTIITLLQNKNKMSKKILVFTIVVVQFTCVIPFYSESPLSPTSIIKALKKTSVQGEPSTEYEEELSKNSINVVVLKEITPQCATFYGDVVPIKESDISFTFPGRLTYVVEEGTYVVSEIKNKDGKILRPGSIIASYDTTETEDRIKEASVECEKAKTNYNYYLNDHEIYSKLVKTSSVSKRNYNMAKYNLDKSIVELDKSKLIYENQKSLLKKSVIKAPFSGIISKTYYSEGQSVNALDTIAKLTKIDLIMVQLQLLPSLSSIVTNKTAFQVFPENSSTPVAGWIKSSATNPDILDIYIKNKEIYVKKTPPSVKSVYKVFPIIKVYSDFYDKNQPGTNETPLAVPVESIKKDKSGKPYIMAIDNDYKEDVNKKLESVFVVKKIYVETGDLDRKFLMNNNAVIDIVSLKPNKDLDEYHIAVIEGSDDLEDGNRAEYVKKSWLFYPGQKVKIMNPSLSSKGFYVPPESIISVGEYDNYVYMVNDEGKLKLEKVNITGYSKGFYAIKGKTIKENAKVAIVDTEDMYEKLYDGAQLSVKSSYDPSAYLTAFTAKRKYILSHEDATQKKDTTTTANATAKILLNQARFEQK